jgi:chemotaxis protein MotB
MKITFLLTTLSLLVCSCIVSKKKFDDMLAQKVRVDAELQEKTTELEKLTSAYGSLEQNFSQLKSDTSQLNNNLRVNNKKLISLEVEHAQLNTLYKNLLNNSGKMNRDLSQQQQQLLSIQQNLEKTRRENDSLNTSLAEREKKVVELEKILANKDKAVQELRSRISNALLNFKENDLTVKVKNGKVYVSLAEQLLFGSGSIAVDAKGVGALQQLAKALKDQKDINIMVEGHTDNVPISKKSQYMQDNWDLSVMRATAITKILISGGVAPKQVVPAGKGEFTPLVSNDNTQNKQKNRRTEIIVTPNLDELFKLLEAN